MKTKNIRIWESTHERLKELSKEKKQDMTIVLDDLVK